MKKHIRQISKLAACLMVLAGGICAVLTFETVAQKKPKPTTKEKVY